VLDDDASRPFFRRALEADASLKRLGTDYVDLYQIHRFDYETPRSGLKVSRICLGCMSYSMQNHYNLLYREEEREMLPLCREEGLGVIPWSPLARGLLAGNRKPGDLQADREGGATKRTQSDDYAHRLYYSEQDEEIVGRTVEVAEKRGVSPAQVALAWLLAQPAVTAPIVGATKMHHLDEALAAVDLELTDEEIAHLEAPYRPRPVLGHGYPDAS
jgi:aryl-alcohol dehydrogenase (NADP+)